MSITDERRPADQPSTSHAQGEHAFERNPPQDVAAEQCVLGGMMLSKDAVADVVEILRAVDFYRPAHATVFEAVLDLYGRGEPADVITVAAALADSGDLARVGGAPYLHTLIASVPTAANSAYYARIVSERAVLRRLIEAGTRVVQLGYGAVAGAGRDVDELVDLAQQAVYDVTERRISEDFAVLSDILQPTLDEIEAVGAQGGVMTGVPTGFTDLDRLLNGLHAGQLIVVAGRPGLGKALALDTPLPTPEGWTTMGQVGTGDRLLAADGSPTTVLSAFDVMHGRPCFEVEFSDGSVIVADADHLWTTSPRAGRGATAGRTPRWSAGRGPAAATAPRAPLGPPDGPVASGGPARPAVAGSRHVLHVLAQRARPSGEPTRGRLRRGCAWPGVTAHSRRAVHAARSGRLDRPGNAGTGTGRTLTTAQIAESLRHPVDGRPNHAVRNCRPIALPHRDDLPVPPYALGVWLGGGGRPAARVATGGRQVVARAGAGGPLVGPRSAPPRHIPIAYRRASEAQRRALLAGLLDAGGTVSRGGSVRLALADHRLAEDTRELIASLGYRCSMTHRPARAGAAEGSTVYTVDFSTTDDVFHPGRKRRLHERRRRSRDAARARSRFIVAVRPVPSVPVRCVTVDSADHLYLAGRSMIPTHNSTAAMDFARATSVRSNLASAIFSLEMSKVEIVMRLLSAEARVPLHILRSGQLSDDDWTKLARRMGEISEAPLFVDDTPNMTLMEIRAKARRLKQRHDLKLVIVDYLQLMTSPKRVESRQQEVAELSRGLKLLAKEIECPVVAVSQLNRGPEQRTDKRPQLSDLRESGSIEQDADVVILLHRDDYYDRESPRAGEADFIVAKHRNGPTDTVTVAAQLHLSRFVDMAIT